MGEHWKRVMGTRTVPRFMVPGDLTMEVKGHNKTKEPSKSVNSRFGRGRWPLSRCAWRDPWGRRSQTASPRRPRWTAGWYLPDWGSRRPRGSSVWRRGLSTSSPRSRRWTHPASPGPLWSLQYNRLSWITPLFIGIFKKQLILRKNCMTIYNDKLNVYLMKWYNLIQRFIRNYVCIRLIISINYVYLYSLDYWKTGKIQNLQKVNRISKIINRCWLIINTCLCHSAVRVAL